jgi:nicotinate-nucleotide pyrophosphorylase (carboxylating)
VDELLRAALAADLGEGGDITSALAFGGRGVRSQGRIVAKAAGRLSGVDLAARVFALVDEATEVSLACRDGASVRESDVVLSVAGSAASLLEAERTALNVLAHLSGVATLTARFVAAVAGTKAHVVDTRKTTPGMRGLEKAAVLHGGGSNHRMGLYDEILLKENHFALAGGGHRELVSRVKSEAPSGMRVIAEARDLDEACAVADGGADVLLLDNFSVEQLAAAVVKLATHARRPAFEIEASGGVTLDNIAAIAQTGVDRISVGALTHSAPALDLSMLIEGPRGGEA